MPQSMHLTHSTAQSPSPGRARTLLLPPTTTDLWHLCSRHRPHDAGCPHQGSLCPYKRANGLQSEALPTKRVGSTGTPPPPMYATLYFSIHEKETILRKYGRCFLLCKRYIDDVFGIWYCANENLHRQLWRAFQANLDRFGKR
jgi:hypothetical protein